jgi:hypothetical protein
MIPRGDGGKKSPATGYLMHISDSAGSISATINVSHQSHFLRLRRYLTAQSGCSAYPLKKESVFESCESNSGSPGRARISRNPLCRECRSVSAYL